MEEISKKWFAKGKQIIGCSNCECTITCGVWKKVIISGIIGIIVGAYLVHEFMG
tara:strand:+ start:4846 stop:5007 length:162 start_codon:yes stop_codon:yes gene_type:complete